MGWFFLCVAAVLAAGLFRVTRQGRHGQKYLSAAREEAPLQIEHLPPHMQRIASDTRLLRVSLESPVRTVRQYIEGDLEATGEDVDGFDNMLMNVTRQLSDWLGTIDRLSESERASILDAGGNPAAIRHALEREGWAFERRNLEMKGQPPMNERLRHVVQELERVEHALQTSSRIYR